MADFTLNTGANILIACALAVVAYALGGPLGRYGSEATQHALAWYLPDAVLGCVTVFYLGDFGDAFGQSFKIGFASAVTARLIWRFLLMWRVYSHRGKLGAHLANYFCFFAIAALAFKAWGYVVTANGEHAGLQSINQTLGIVCLVLAVPTFLWLVGKPRG